ncbi:3-oxoacyl-[acyl-carrier-protein] synthase III C-terminal domain-containing protein [Zavarzinia sp. CC-PAN008]|uniref:3-oxoacyl-[acyl-carrier-protein] synthase III C-terminal domain-containing protein n=1 Tax=Zavarzinia sp. CC-PAN008 TaxID=3243332 RepID=UPI003F745B92
MGRHLPGPTIGNEDIPAYLGPMDRRQRRIGREALRQNGIRGRHYALDRDGTPNATNAGLAAAAIRDALDRAELDPAQVRFLACATSQGDLLAPGFASMVHGELATGNRPLPPVEIASFHSFCASGMMALRAGVNAVAAGAVPNAVVCASELISRYLRHGYANSGPAGIDAEFLRWMLSDGAGAVVLEDRPNAAGLSLRVEFVDLVSYADRLPTCMYAGSNQGPDRTMVRPWGSYPSLGEAVSDGALILKQDLELLENIVPLGVARYFELVDRGLIPAGGVDWTLYHYSSDAFRARICEAAAQAGAPVDEARMFTNLNTKGNTGSASIFIMLEELFNEGRLEPGQTILCMVPESGRFIIGYMLLTVVGQTRGAPSPPADVEPIFVPSGGSALKQQLVRGLTQVWTEFETALNTVPVIDRLNRRRFRIEDYRRLLMNLRQQVAEGARWIARAASNIPLDKFELRSTFLGHAHEEHRDFRLVEQDFVAAGGRLEEIRAGAKNIGSEALSAWMFQRASQPDPVDLLGAMFIIEGLGNRLAARWGRMIQEQLNLPGDAVHFLTYHGANDDTHVEKMWSAFDHEGLLTEESVAAILKTARVTARLYRLQLEELDNV